MTEFEVSVDRFYISQLLCFTDGLWIALFILYQEDFEPWPYFVRTLSFVPKTNIVLILLTNFFIAIAVNNVEDTRPVLDYYKQEGGEKNILETFKGYQAQLMAQERDWKRQMEVQRKVKSNYKKGRILPFSLQRKPIRSDTQVSISMS